MCIAYLAIGCSPKWPLVIAANRDESHHRPTRAAAPWDENKQIIGGKDLEAGGTWFAVNKNGRFALLTNHRNLGIKSEATQSRGELTANFLNSELSADAYMDQVAHVAHLYQGFNLVVGQWQDATRQFIIYYYSNRSDQAPALLPAGHYVLSNHLLNTPWPKSQRLLENLSAYVNEEDFSNIDEAYTLLRDQTKADDDILPQTGLSLEFERLLSSPFIISPDYGTRSSAMWLVNEVGQSYLHECTYNPQGIETERHSWPIRF